MDNICTDVEKCIYANQNSCIECQDGYYYNIRNKTCIEMKHQFLNCKYSCLYDENICCECKNDYYLFEDDNLCYDNN